MGRHDSAFRATLTGIFDQLGAGGVRLPDHVRADDETILVTGASRGLGLALTEELARRGARVVMACRSRIEEAPADVHARVYDAEVEVLPVDLTEPASVEGLLRELADRGETLDRVVLNAGVVPQKSRQTASGLDIMIHVHLAANAQLVMGLRERGLLKPGARVVFVGSDAHRQAALDLTQIESPADYGVGGVVKKYGESKRLLHTWVSALAARADDIEVVHLCPGGVATDIAREAPFGMGLVVKPVMSMLFASPAKAAQATAFGVLAPDLESGTYLHLGREKEPGDGVRDPEAMDAVWEAAEAVRARLIEESKET